jgi:carbon monoxide dehydrogenase subunit G
MFVPAMDAVTRDATDEAGTKGLEAIFRVDVPPDALLEVLWSTANFGRLFPDLKEVKVLAGAGDELDVSYRVNVVIKEIGYVLRRNCDRTARTITWREIGGDLKRVRGSWALEPMNDGRSSQATYRAFVEVGRFVPTGMVRDAAKKKLDEMIERVRRVAKEIHGGSR